MQSSVSDTLKDRDSKYGDYGQQSRTAQQLKDFFRQAPGWSDVTFHQRESLDMIAAKISRILHGDASHYDSWHDIAGYAELGGGWRPPK